MGVSENSGTPKSSILIGFSIINHPIWGTPIFGNAQMLIEEDPCPCSDQTASAVALLDLCWFPCVG